MSRYFHLRQLSEYVGFTPHGPAMALPCPTVRYAYDVDVYGDDLGMDMIRAW